MKYELGFSKRMFILIYIKVFLYIEGKIADPTTVKLFNNSLSFLFDQVRLEINGVEVGGTRVLEITSSLKGYLTCTLNNYHCYQNNGRNLNNKS
jgi:hypothetical protein